jgi:hypothetical protein
LRRVEVAFFGELIIKSPLTPLFQRGAIICDNFFSNLLKTKNDLSPFEKGGLRGILQLISLPNHATFVITRICSRKSFLQGMAPNKRPLILVRKK